MDFGIFSDGHGPAAGADDALQDAIEIGDLDEVEAARKGLGLTRALMRDQR